MTTWPSVDLPAPLGPMMTWVSPRAHGEVDAVQDGASRRPRRKARGWRGAYLASWFVMCGAFL